MRNWKWYYKVLIIVLIMFILKIFNIMTITNVQAETIDNGTIEFRPSANTTITGYENNTYYSNLDSEDINTLGLTTSGYFTAYELNNGEVIDNIPYGNFSIGQQVDISTNNNGTNDIFVNSFQLPTSNGLGFILHKSDSNFYSFVMQLDNINGSSSYGTDIDFLEYGNVGISIKEVEHDRWYSSNTNAIQIINANFKTFNDYAYLQVSFRLDNNEDYSENYWQYYTDFYLWSITFDSGMTFEEIDNSVYLDNSSNFLNKSNVGNGALSFRINKVIFLENADIVWDTNFINDDYDHVSLKDLEVFDSLQQCSLTDIGCHLNNIITLIKGLFTRIGNLFSVFINRINIMYEYLFVPTIDFEESLNNIKDEFLGKLGCLTYPFELFEDFTDRLEDVNIHDNWTITLPPLVEPFSNTTLYSGGEYNLKYYMTYGSLATLYSWYYLFITAYIIFLFLCFLSDSYDNLLRGSMNNSSSLTNQLISEINDNTGGYVPKHSYSPTSRSEIVKKGGLRDL